MPSPRLPNLAGSPSKANNPCSNQIKVRGTLYVKLPNENTYKAFTVIGGASFAVVSGSSCNPRLHIFEKETVEPFFEHDIEDMSLTYLHDTGTVMWTGQVGGTQQEMAFVAEVDDEARNSGIKVVSELTRVIADTFDRWLHPPENVESVENADCKSFNNDEDDDAPLACLSDHILLPEERSASSEAAVAANLSVEVSDVKIDFHDIEEVLAYVETLSNKMLRVLCLTGGGRFEADNERYNIDDDSWEMCYSENSAKTIANIKEMLEEAKSLVGTAVGADANLSEYNDASPGFHNADEVLAFVETLHYSNMQALCLAGGSMFAPVNERYGITEENWELCYTNA